MICSPKEKNIAGQKFGRLTAIRRDFSKKHLESYWFFQCDCGNVKSMNKRALTQKRASSCGCAQKDAARRNLHEYNKVMGRVSHGRTDHELYNVWAKMKARCHNKDDAAYSRYGGRGIVVCDRWFDIDNFIADMGDRPNGATIDRIDNDKGYSPDNCKWATMLEQGNNRRTNRQVVIDDVIYSTISEAIRETGFTRDYINYHYP